MDLSDPVGGVGIGAGSGSASASGAGTGQNVEMVQLVRVARQELAGVISTLTELLATVRVSNYHDFFLFKSTKERFISTDRTFVLNLEIDE